jgi:hydroxymethylbilane synthase
MRLKLASRASALAVLQTALAARALRSRWPSLRIETVTRTSRGDRDPKSDLWSQPEPGFFTSDLSKAVIDGDADVVVHSWKDLPLATYPGTEIAATLERADPRDVLLVRADVLDRRPRELVVLSSSPRRAWQLETSLPRLLSWSPDSVRSVAVRGNIPTRLQKLIDGSADGLVVAKAALDRLLSADSPADGRRTVRTAVERCRWMVLPLKEFPTAPAQGALALEVASHRSDVLECVRAVDHAATRSAVESERAILESYGGGCHEAIGSTVLIRDYGRVVSVRARFPGTLDRTTWSLVTTHPVPPRVPVDRTWPRPDERHRAQRRPLDVHQPKVFDGVWVARAEALPESWTPDAFSVVWAAGSRTWERLASRGIWVNGCADGLGDAEQPNVDLLAGRDVEWRRLTHNRSADPTGLATYAVDDALPADLGQRTHFFWTSGSLFREAVETFPSIRDGWHASGPGRTSRILRDTLGPAARASVWLDYDQWHHAVTF